MQNEIDTLVKNIEKLKNENSTLEDKVATLESKYEEINFELHNSCIQKDLLE